MARRLVRGGGWMGWGRGEREHSFGLCFDLRFKKKSFFNLFAALPPKTGLLARSVDLGHFSCTGGGGGGVVHEDTFGIPVARKLLVQSQGQYVPARGTQLPTANKVWRCSEITHQCMHLPLHVLVVDTSRLNTNDQEALTSKIGNIQVSVYSNIDPYKAILMLRIDDGTLPDLSDACIEARQPSVVDLWPVSAPWGLLPTTVNQTSRLSLVRNIDSWRNKHI